MTVAEVRSKYGDKEASFVEKTMAEKPECSVFVFRLRNPKYTRPYLTIKDVVGYWDRNGEWITRLPDEVRYSDTVRVER